MKTMRLYLYEELLPSAQKTTIENYKKTKGKELVGALVEEFEDDLRQFANHFNLNYYFALDKNYCIDRFSLQPKSKAAYLICNIGYANLITDLTNIKEYLRRYDIKSAWHTFNRRSDSIPLRFESTTGKKFKDSKVLFIDILNTTNATWMDKMHSFTYSLLREGKGLRDLLNGLTNRLYKCLRYEIEELLDDKNIEEYLISKQYYFLEDGNAYQA